MLLVAAAAMFDEDNRLLITSRPEGKPMAGLWEFPGGKVHEGEMPEEALVRELKEELNITTSPCCLTAFTFTTYPLGQNNQDYEKDRQGGCDPLRECKSFDPDDMLMLMLYICRRWNGIATPMESQELKWIRPQNLSQYQMPPADKPFITMLRDYFVL